MNKVKTMFSKAIKSKTQGETPKEAIDYGSADTICQICQIVTFKVSAAEL